MLPICCGYRVSIDFWLFPSSLRLVCIYITLVLCQQNLFFKNLAQSKARIEPHTAWILDEIVPVNTRGSRAEIWLLHEGLAYQPVSLHCFTSACFSPFQTGNGGWCALKLFLLLLLCQWWERLQVCVVKPSPLCYLLTSSGMRVLLPPSHAGSPPWEALGVLRDNKEAVLPWLQSGASHNASPLHTQHLGRLLIIDCFKDRPWQF